MQPLTGCKSASSCAGHVNTIANLRTGAYLGHLSVPSFCACLPSIRISIPLVTPLAVSVANQRSSSVVALWEVSAEVSPRLNPRAATQPAIMLPTVRRLASRHFPRLESSPPRCGRRRAPAGSSTGQRWVNPARSRNADCPHIISALRHFTRPRPVPPVRVAARYGSRRTSMTFDPSSTAHIVVALAHRRGRRASPSSNELLATDWRRDAGARPPRRLAPGSEVPVEVGLTPPSRVLRRSTGTRSLANRGRPRQLESGETWRVRRGIEISIDR